MVNSQRTETSPGRPAPRPQSSGALPSTQADGLPQIQRVADFELERVMAAARRSLFGERAALLPAIGRYRIDRRIGAGGMGEVYLGFDAELERHAAIKLVRAELSRARGPERLRLEAKALARLAHPNVVRVYEVGEHQGRTFLAMEYVPGRTLGEWLADTKPSWPEILTLFVAAGRGLAAAHAAGIVHRDFKPANVLLTNEGQVLVADFGLALAGAVLDDPLPGAHQAIELWQPPDERLSMTGMTLGTLRFMPLEQLEAGEVDHRADQFAFCVSLYEALWSQPPFPATSLTERRAALSQDPRRPPRDRVPTSLWRILRRGLSRAPAQRWPDMDTLLDALEAVPRRRRRLAISALMVPALAGLGGLAAAAWPSAPVIADPCATDDDAGQIDLVWSASRRAALDQAFRATGLPFAKASASATAKQLDQWRAAWLDEREQLCRATVSGALADQVSGLRGACLARVRADFDATVEVLLHADAETVTRAAELAANLPSLDACHDDQTLLLGVAAPPAGQQGEVDRLRRALASIRARARAGHHEGLEAALTTLLEDARASAYRPLIAEALVVRAQLEFSALSVEAAVASYEQAIDLAEATRHDQLLSHAWLDLAMHAVHDLRDPERAANWLRRASASNERVGVDPRASWRLEFVHAKVAELRGDTAAAEQRLRALLTRLAAPELAQDPALGLLRPAYVSHLATMVARAPHRDDEVLALRREALALAEANFPAGHPEIATHAHNLGQALLAAGREQEARPLLERAAALWLDTHRAPDPQLGLALLSMTQLELAANDLASAQTHAEQAEQIFARSWPEAYQQRANAAMSSAVVAHMRGELRIALGGYDRAAALFASVAGIVVEQDPTIALVNANAGACALELGELELARERFDAATTLDSPGPHAIVAQLGLAQLDLRAAQLELAREHLRVLEGQRSGFDAGDLLEYELLGSVLALRSDGPAPTPNAGLLTAINNPDHEHHRRLDVATRTMHLTRAERAALHLETRHE